MTFLGCNIQISSKFCVLKITKIGSILTDSFMQPFGYPRWLRMTIHFDGSKFSAIDCSDA